MDFCLSVCDYYGVPETPVRARRTSRSHALLFSRMGPTPIIARPAATAAPPSLFSARLISREVQQWVRVQEPHGFNNIGPPIPLYSVMATTSAFQPLTHAIPPPLSIPPAALATAVRVRPGPTYVAGGPHPNNDSQPPGKPPSPRHVWVQGKWRDAISSAAKQESQKLSRRVERALQARNHGYSIYAYSHINTKQVVYSLSRIMEEKNIKRQLIYHGKKTVPADIRRDVWLPYYSVHFPSTSLGKYSGLLAYRRLEGAE